MQVGIIGSYKWLVSRGDSLSVVIPVVSLSLLNYQSLCKQAISVRPHSKVDQLHSDYFTHRKINPPLSHPHPVTGCPQTHLWTFQFDFPVARPGWYLFRYAFIADFAWRQSIHDYMQLLALILCVASKGIKQPMRRVWMYGKNKFRTRAVTTTKTHPHTHSHSLPFGSLHR